MNKLSENISINDYIPTAELAGILFFPQPSIEANYNVDNNPINFANCHSEIQQNLPSVSSSANDFFENNSIHYINLLEKLNSFKLLEHNWNGYGASRIKDSIISKAKIFLSLISKISKDLSIFPTARSSIQIEIEFPNGFYSEVEIFSESIKVYIEKPDENDSTTSYSNIEEASNKFLEIYESRIC